MVSNEDTGAVLVLSISKDSFERFTTLLQSGSIFSINQKETISSFLLSLPGFTEDYIINRVQTIFLDGNAVDDLSISFTNPESVLAVSAAMPGLAGAIFRKNSMHAALRSGSTLYSDSDQSNVNVSVTLKLFNMIAIERGIELLQNGITVYADVVRSFLHDRPSLFKSIHRVEFNSQQLYPDMLLSALPEIHSTINLRITCYGSNNS